MFGATMINVIVHGAAGKMGCEVLRALCSDAELEAAGAVDLKADSERLPLPDGCGEIPFSADLETVLSQTNPDVMVDFTIREAAMPAIRTAARHGINLVIGSTGLSSEDIGEIDKLCRQSDIGAVVAPNFSLGAILMIHMAKLAASYFDYAEIIEKHHEAKADAPSGTATFDFIHGLIQLSLPGCIKHQTAFIRCFKTGNTSTQQSYRRIPVLRPPGLQ